MQAVALVSQLTIWISVLIYFTNVNPLFKCPISLVHFSDQENAQSSQNFDKTHEKGQEENDFNLQRAINVYRNRSMSPTTTCQPSVVVRSETSSWYLNLFLIYCLT